MPATLDLSAVRRFTEDLNDEIAAISPYKRMAALNGIEYTAARIAG